MKKTIAYMLILVIILAIVPAGVSADITDYKKLAADKFKDIKDSDWFAEAVGKLNVLKIIDGLPDGRFNPQGEVTRAQFVKMLVQALEYKKTDSVSFDDLKPFPTSKPHWASVYIETALRNGVIVKSETGSNFYPDAPIRRVDMMMMMYRALQLTPSSGENPFADLTEANGCYTKLYEEYLVRGTIVSGKRLFNPESPTTRAEAAVIIDRMVEYKDNPKAFVDKLKRQENLHAVAPNGVPVRLYEYTDGTKGRTFNECNEEYLDFISYLGESYAKTNGYIYSEIATFGGSEAFLKYQVDVARRYMKYSFNIDYRTVGEDYKKRIADAVYRGLSYTLDRNIEEFKKHKVVCKSEFLTDYDLVFHHQVAGESLRGTLRIKFEASTSPEYLKKYKVEAGKWYDIDVNIKLSRASVSEFWYIDGKKAIDYLAEPIVINR